MGSNFRNSISSNFLTPGKRARKRGGSLQGTSHANMDMIRIKEHCVDTLYIQNVRNQSPHLRATGDFYGMP